MTSNKVVNLIVGVLIFLLGTWFFMIGVGVVHHEWITTLPTISWWHSALVCFLFRAALVAMTYGTSWGGRE